MLVTQRENAAEWTTASYQTLVLPSLCGQEPIAAIHKHTMVQWYRALMLDENDVFWGHSW